MTGFAKPTALQRVRETAQLAHILTHLSRRRSDLVYRVLSAQHVMGDTSLFINLGYWRDARTLDEASLHLADLLAKEAGFASGDRVLDVGFGFADQDLRWAETYEGLSIDGLNITPLQVGLARERVSSSSLADRIALHEGDALDPPFAPDTFDHVVALECAFHFASRAQFFDAAHRVLRPGGRIALADFIAAPAYLAKRSLRHRLARLLGTFAWQIPAQNLCGVEEYVAMLGAAGFENVRVRSIAADVFVPFERYQRARFDTEAFRRRYHPLIRFMAKAQIDLGFLHTLDYVVVTGEKPA